MPSAPSLPSTRRLTFARLRTAHDVTLRELVHSSWDETTAPAENLASSWRHVRSRRNQQQSYQHHHLPPRSATDVSGAAIHAARLAQVAAQEAADASATAAAAADYARRLLAAECGRASTREDAMEGEAAEEVWVVDGDRKYPDDNVSGGEEEEDEEPSDGDKQDCIEEIQRRSVVWPAARPVLLGKVWSFDMVAVWHNAIRHDLCDLFVILETVKGAGKVRNTVNVMELRALFAWFSTFEAFVLTRLKAEEEVLYPWLEQWGRIKGDLSTASRITTKGTIIRGIRDTAACAAILGLERESGGGMVLMNPDRNYYDALKVGFAEIAPSLENNTDVDRCAHVVEKVTTLVAAFSNALLDYFREQERLLPLIIDSLYDPQDMYADSIERRMVRAMWKCGRKDESMVMLLRAVEDSPNARQWICRNLRRFERLAMPLWKRRYNAARGAVVARFKERKRFWERCTVSMDAPYGLSVQRPNLRSMPANYSSLNYGYQDRSHKMASSLDNNFHAARGT